MVNMKIAIFHDYIDTIGGGEKLVLTLARELNADVITTDINKDSIKKMEFDDVDIISLGKTVKLPPLKQISASIKFASCDFSKRYDFFIFSGNWAPFAAKKHKPNLYYCHTPVRAFYDTYDLLLQRQSLLIRPIFIVWVTVHESISKYYINYVERIVANSKNTQSRIKMYLGRDAKIIYPPIDVRKYGFKEFGDFWLSVNRLYPEKRIDLQIETFRSMPDEKLIIVGSFAEGDHSSKYVEKIRQDLPKNVELRSNVSEKDLICLYSKCRGFIATAIDEDFGMAPIEAMASGKPVIAVKEGGYLESIIDRKTGIFIEPNVDSMTNTMKIISENGKNYRKECEEQAKKFDKSIFIKNIKEIIEDHKKIIKYRGK